jgi:hypothetical protein
MPFQIAKLKHVITKSFTFYTMSSRSIHAIEPASQTCRDSQH